MIVTVPRKSTITFNLVIGKYTYQDDMTTEKMAEVCMSNYDSAFSSIAKEQDILVSGFNFGCGSSREQAATAILARKIPLVVAGSFGNTFSRNSINNALPTLELPKLVQLLRTRFSGSSETLNDEAPIKEKRLTQRTGLKLRWDVRRSLVEVSDTNNHVIFRKKVGEMPPNVQEIIAAGGLENRVRQEVAKQTA